ncbi:MULTISPECIES: acyl-CoA dehydrogenase family protein [unclassified Spirillospora]|uniref:acyl-CoA dehydrogenase family protein n=1 Tax=unclassified Spirillospora TaxID=2642701 RepID=UPI003720ACB2
MTIDPALQDMMASVFSDHDPAAPAGSLWGTLESLGLARLTTPAGRGGSGAGWAEAAALLRTAASHGVSVPLAENDLLANWLLAEADLPSDESLRTACVLDGTGTAKAVPWAGDADRITLLWAGSDGWRAADVPASSLHIERAANLAGEPRDAVHAPVDTMSGTRVGEHVAEEFMLRGALARALQTTGAMDGILRLSVEHAATRTQFGRPLARFQAVQHLIADMAAEASLAKAATDTVLRDGLTPFNIAVARSCTGHATATVVRNAHQVHGAIGTTAEHPLHRYTLPALAWSAEFGSLHHWDELLTRAAVSADQGIWHLITNP